jgi:hypothetical protein
MIALSDEELIDILENRIPALLERRPDLRRRIYSGYVDLFAKHEEVAAIIQELRALSASTAEFQAETRQTAARQASELHEFKLETRQNFEQVDRRFEQVDRRFEQVDQRFEQVDQRFEQVDQRFEQVDQRFEQVDQRFEQVDQKLEQVDQRLGQVDQKLEQMGDHVDSFTREMRQFRDWMQLTDGRLRTRMGRNLEKFVASGLSYGLRRPDIHPESIQLRQKIVDTEGIVFKPGRVKEVDIVATNGELLVFEIKSAAKRDDVDDLAEKVALVQYQNPDKLVRGVLVTLAPELDVRQRAGEIGIDLPPMPDEQ